MSSIASAISGSAFLLTIGLILISLSIFYVGIQIGKLLKSKNY